VIRDRNAGTVAFRYLHTVGTARERSVDRCPRRKRKRKKERSAVASSRAYSLDRLRVWSRRKLWIVAASNPSIQTPPVRAM